MACGNCDYKGIVIFDMMTSGGLQKLVRPCLECNDTKAYYRHIKQRYGRKDKSRKIKEDEDNLVSLSDRRK